MEIELGGEYFKILGIEFSLILATIKKMQECGKIMSYWSYRNTAVLGGITLAESLLLPKSNHLFAALSDPSQNVTSQSQTLFHLEYQRRQ